jgi:hypothetical protein
MLEVIGGIVSSVFAGGATGIIGVIAQRFADYKNRQLDLQLKKMEIDGELAKREMDAKIMAQEWAGRTKVAEVEADGRSDVAESEAFSASFKMEPQRYFEGPRPKGFVGGLIAFMMASLDYIRGVVRPGLTLYLCVITTMIYLDALALSAMKNITSDQAFQMIKTINDTILYLTTTCVLWWFGTRNRQSAPNIK